MNDKISTFEEEPFEKWIEINTHGNIDNDEQFLDETIELFKKQYIGTFKTTEHFCENLLQNENDIDLTEYWRELKMNGYYSINLNNGKVAIFKDINESF